MDVSVPLDKPMKMNVVAAIVARFVRHSKCAAAPISKGRGGRLIRLVEPDVGFFYRRNSGILDRTLGILTVRTDLDGWANVGDSYTRHGVDLSLVIQIINVVNIFLLGTFLASTSKMLGNGWSKPRSPQRDGRKAYDK